MNLLSGNFSLQLELTLASLLARAVESADPDEDGRSPSTGTTPPEEAGTGVGSPPLKRSSTKVALEGHLIQVEETRIGGTRGDASINASIIKMETL
jgi:hypothetical protein